MADTAAFAAVYASRSQVDNLLVMTDASSLETFPASSALLAHADTSFVMADTSSPEGFFAVADPVLAVSAASRSQVFFLRNNTSANLFSSFDTCSNEDFAADAAKVML